MEEKNGKRWIHALLERSGLHALAAKFHVELEQHQQATQVLRTWQGSLLAARNSIGFPILVALLAMISTATALYPFVPVLVAAVVFAPARWRAIYVTAVLGASAGAWLLALAVQTFGYELLANYFSLDEAPPTWLKVQHVVEHYGVFALAGLAALPLPQMPLLLALALAGTSPWAIATAIFAGKSVKYGAYILGVQGVLKVIRRQREITRLTP